jgi:hypothetical protein
MAALPQNEPRHRYKQAPRLHARQSVRHSCRGPSEGLGLGATARAILRFDATARLLSMPLAGMTPTVGISAPIHIGSIECAGDESGSLVRGG